MDTELAPLIEKAAAALKAAGAREVYVFGSASKGKLRPESDVDMVVSGLPPEVFFGAIGKASRALGRPVDFDRSRRSKTRLPATSKRNGSCSVWDRPRRQVAVERQQLHRLLKAYRSVLEKGASTPPIKKA